MKNFIIGFLVGGLIGGGAAYYFTKEYTTKQVEEACQKDINEMKEYYRKKSEGEDPDIQSEDEKKEEEEALKNHVNKVPDKPIPSPYSALTRSYTSDAGRERFEETDPADEEGPQDDEPDVSIITLDEYEEINHRYEHTVLLYYVKDCQLTYEEGENIDSRDTVTGDLVDNEKYLIEDALDATGWRNNDDITEPLYVKNNRISEMFEIHKIFESYMTEPGC